MRDRRDDTWTFFIFKPHREQINWWLWQQGLQSSRGHGMQEDAVKADVLEGVASGEVLHRAPSLCPAAGSRAGVDE